MIFILCVRRILYSILDNSIVPLHRHHSNWYCHNCHLHQSQSVRFKYDWNHLNFAVNDHMIFNKNVVDNFYFLAKPSTLYWFQLQPCLHFFPYFWGHLCVLGVWLNYLSGLKICWHNDELKYANFFLLYINIIVSHQVLCLQ